MKAPTKMWMLVSFGDVIINMTNGLGGKQNKEGRGIPVSRIETIADQAINYDRIGYLAEYDKIKIDKYRLNTGDILFSHINSSTHLGKTALIGEKDKLYHGINLLRIVINPKVYYSKLFNYFCKLMRLEGEFSLRAQHAVNQSSLNQKKLSEFEILLPSLTEQKEISSRLDELLAQVNTIKTRIDAIPAILKRFRQSVLSAAVSGKLTEEWRRRLKKTQCIKSTVVYLYESLLKSVSSNSEKKKLDEVYGAAERPIGILEKIPSTWIMTNLAKLCEPFSYGTSSKSSSVGNVPVIRMGNIQEGELNWNSLVYTSDKGEIDKFNLREKDILFNRTNSPELVGKTAIYRGVRKSIYAGYIIRARCLNLLVPEYLNYLLNSPYGRNYCWQVKSDGVSQSNINAKKLGSFVVPLTSYDEQTQIVNQVEKLFTFADQIEQRVKAAQALIDNLTQSILAKAFRGELTAEWREQNLDLISGENSAEMLLAKIKLEKEALKSTKKVKGKTLT